MRDQTIVGDTPRNAASEGDLGSYLPARRRELLELRENQRRLLRAVPDEFLKDATWFGDFVPAGAPPAADIELYVRRRAEAQLSKETLEYLEACHDGNTSAAATKRLLSLDTNQMATAREEASGLIAAAYPHLAGSLRDEPYASAKRFAVLALLADEYADDEYVDSRTKRRL